jgi:hypothetical protein
VADNFQQVFGGVRGSSRSLSELPVGELMMQYQRDQEGVFDLMISYVQRSPDGEVQAGLERMLYDNFPSLGLRLREGATPLTVEQETRYLQALSCRLPDEVDLVSWPIEEMLLNVAVRSQHVLPLLERWTQVLNEAVDQKKLSQTPLQGRLPLDILAPHAHYHPPFIEAVARASKSKMLGSSSLAQTLHSIHAGKPQAFPLLDAWKPGVLRSEEDIRIVMTWLLFLEPTDARVPGLFSRLEQTVNEWQDIPDERLRVLLRADIRGMLAAYLHVASLKELYERL